MARTESTTVGRIARATAAAVAVAIVGVASPVLADPVPPAPVNTIGLSCEGELEVGSEIDCTVSNGVPDIDILWEAAYNPVFATAGVMLDAAGTGTFSFVIPAAAIGREVTVELVEWLAPVSLGVVGGPLPTGVPAGALDGQFISDANRPAAIVSLAALVGLLALVAARRRSSAAADSTRA
jgi:hypothetical protein